MANNLIALDKADLDLLAAEIASGVIVKEVIGSKLREMIFNAKPVDDFYVLKSEVRSMKQEIETYVMCRCSGRGTCRKCRVLK